MKFFLLGMGSNICPTRNIKAAMSALEDVGRVISASPILKTEPVGETFHYEFCNQLVILASDLPAPLLKHRLQLIEVQLGREPKSPARKTLDRTIDIDILDQATSIEECRHSIPEESYYLRVHQLWNQSEKV